MSTFWRAAQLSYLEYVNHASNAVRAALKEPMRSKAAARGNIHLRERWYDNGVASESKFILSFFFCLFYYFIQFPFKMFVAVVSPVFPNLALSRCLQKSHPIPLCLQLRKQRNEP